MQRADLRISIIKTHAAFVKEHIRISVPEPVAGHCHVCQLLVHKSIQSQSTSSQHDWEVTCQDRWQHLGGHSKHWNRHGCAHCLDASCVPDATQVQHVTPPPDSSAIDAQHLFQKTDLSGIRGWGLALAASIICENAVPLGPGTDPAGSPTRFACPGAQPASWL